MVMLHCRWRQASTEGRQEERTESGTEEGTGGGLGSRLGREEETPPGRQDQGRKRGAGESGAGKVGPVVRCLSDSRL